jgi:hypothetical protein
MKTGSVVKHTLGIMVCEGRKNKYPPFFEAPYFMQMAREGKKHGIRVIVFNPRHINWYTRKVPCWIATDDGKWTRGVEPLPRLIYDRLYYTDSNHYLKYKPHVLRIADDPNIRLLGRALGGKMKTYEILKRCPEIRPFLPPTVSYQTPRDVLRMLDKFPAVIIKPNGGSHGRGVVAISRVSGKWFVRGRTKDNQTFQNWISGDEKLQDWIRNFIRDTKYVIQPFLDLATSDGRPYDVRILVQKNERRQWETTGMAVRIGKPFTITSNLHGGGQAVVFTRFISKNFPEPLTRAIQKKIWLISSMVPPFIEEHHGPLVELGVDVGIDRRGDVWILEVNSKPGRAVFIKTGELAVRKRAIQLPIRYACALLEPTGGSI